MVKRKLDNQRLNDATKFTELEENLLGNGNGIHEASSDSEDSEYESADDNSYDSDTLEKLKDFKNSVNSTAESEDENSDNDDEESGSDVNVDSESENESNDDSNAEFSDSEYPDGAWQVSTMHNSEEETSDANEISSEDSSKKNKKKILTKKKTSKSENGAELKKVDTKPLKSETKKEMPPATSFQSTSQEDEYAEDSSDEEDIRNTVGNIPLQWYSDYAHLGYDWDGKKILKPAQGDKLDDFLRRVEDPDFWRTVFEPYTNQNVVLTDEDIKLIQRIQAQRVPDAKFEEYAPWIEWFTSQVMKTPLRKFPEHKRSFLPSRHEAKKVSKLVHALKMGWIKTQAELEKIRAQKDPQFYMIWNADDTPEHMRRLFKHIPAPKRHLPGHAESYNPPPEYLFDKKELKEWSKLQETPWKRKLHFIPQKHDSLRHVGAYPRYLRERFQRCLDLYLCPRAIKMRLTIDAESLVPKLPSPRDLQPFPTTESMVYRGHTDMIRSISVEGKGQYLASGSDDHTVKIWEISTGRCVKTFKMGDIVRCVAWCPNGALSLIAVAAGKRVDLINPGVGDKLTVSKTDGILEQPPPTDVIENERLKTAINWENFAPESQEWLSGIRVSIHHFQQVSQVTWHGRGDYLATVMPEGHNRSVIISQLSKRRSQLPFSKAKGLVQCVLFHPIRPFLFVATQRNVRIYDLVKQELVKKLLSNSRWISTMAIHPAGDNVLVGTYDRKMLWFDLDLSTKPYQTLRLHGTSVRGVAYHKRYPLFASGSDDRSLIISHGMVYNDLLKNPLIVPLKRVQNHAARNDFGIFGVEFHPIQPWVFSSGADGTIRLYT